MHHGVAVLSQAVAWRAAALACGAVLLLVHPDGSAADSSEVSTESGAGDEMAWLDDTVWLWNEWSNVELEKGGKFVSTSCQDAERCRWWTTHNKLKIRWAEAGTHTMTPSAHAANASTTLRGVRDIDGEKYSASFVRKGVRLFGIRAPAPERLRCEHAPSPLIGLDVPAPRFSWIIPESGAAASYGVVPAGYQIQVTDTFLAKVVWDSGRVASSALGAVYGGPPLANDTSFTWRVRCWLAGKSDLSSTPSSWSDSFCFHTAPSATDWANASWIDGSRGALRKNVALPSGSRIIEAFVFASSIGFHHVLVNGKLIGNQSTYLFEPGQSAYSERALYTSYNVTSEVLDSADGRNAASLTIGALLGNGPCSACGRSGPCTTQKTPINWKGSCTSYISYSPGDATCCKRGVQNNRAFRAIISVLVETAAGAVQRMFVSTAAGEWSTTQSPNLLDDLYTGEVWDGRIEYKLEHGGFWAAGPPPAGLQTASIVKDNGGVNSSSIMSAQLLPSIGIRQSFTPISVTRCDSFLSQGDLHCPNENANCVPPATPNASGSDATSGWIFKFNQSMAGVATLRIRRSYFTGPTRCQWRNNTIPNATVSTVLAPYGCVVLRYGNILEDDGTLMNQFGPITYDQSDVFILGPSQQEQVYQVHFSYHGLQYVWLSGLPSGAAPPPLSMLTAHKTNSAVADTGSVTTDHPVLNWISHAARMSVTDVLQSIGMDVPDRERLGWLGDVSQYSEAAMRMLDTTAFFENQLRNEVDQATISGGWLTAIAPLPFHWSKGDPAWVSALPGIAQHLYEATSDPEIFRRTYAAIKTQVDMYDDVSNGLPSHLLHVSGFGDYINLACTCKIYGASTKAGIIHDTGIRCNALVGDDHYYLRALNGLVQMAQVLNDTQTYESMAKVEQAKRQTFAMYYTGTNTTAPDVDLTLHEEAAPPLPLGHSWVSFKLQDEPIFLRTSCGKGYGSSLPNDTADLADMTFDMRPAVNGDKSAISLSVWEVQAGYPCKAYGKECPYFVRATSDGSVVVSKNDGSAAFKASASFTFTKTTGELKTHSGGLVYVADAKVGCSGTDGRPAGIGDLRIAAVGGTRPKRSNWSLAPPLLNSTPPLPVGPPPTPPSPSPSRPGSLKTLTTSNQTQSLLSLVATSNALSPQTEQLAMVAMLNDLMSADENCILTPGTHPDGKQYGCFVQRAHFTGGMEGFKATAEALQQHERVDELYETLSATTWPGFGYMMAQGAAGVLWESWGVQPPLNAGICKHDQACISAGWLGGIGKYWFTVFGGIQQAPNSVGYQQPVLKPLLPMRAGGLDSVVAQMQVPAGFLRSTWTRISSSHIYANFSIPPGSGMAILGIPVLNLSNPTVEDNGVIIYHDGKLDRTTASAHGLTSAHFVQAGSSVSLQMETVGSGSWNFAIRGDSPATVGPVSAKAGTTLTLRCPAGWRIVNIPHVRYGGGGCSSGGAQYLVESNCVLEEVCHVQVKDEIFDPTQYSCRAVSEENRVLTVTAECAAP